MITDKLFHNISGNLRARSVVSPVVDDDASVDENNERRFCRHE